MNPVVLSRALAAAPERVFAAFTDADALTAWFWPSTWDTSVSSDPIVGGRYHIRSEQNQIGVSGTFTTLTPFTFIAFTWKWDGESAESVVSVTIEPMESGSTVTLEHAGLASETDRQNHADGWQSCLDRLPAYLSGGKAI
jgi:uncharacterized protein YndB with AHSA1/START domain